MNDYKSVPQTIRKGCKGCVMNRGKNTDVRNCASFEELHGLLDCGRNGVVHVKINKNIDYRVV